MGRITIGRASLTRKFALLSLVTIGFITAVQVSVQWLLFREDLLDRERTSTASIIRAGAYAMLQPEDFSRWRSKEAQERFERFFRRALLNPEILRVKVFDTQTRVVWSDEPPLLGARFSKNASLTQALQGQTVARLHTVKRSEKLYEQNFRKTIELYIPLAFSSGQTPGMATVAGVVEVYKSPARVLAAISRGRVMIISTSLAGAVLLYATLFGVVHRASRQLQAQRDDLERQTTALIAANRDLQTTQQRLRTAERLATLGEVSAMVAHGIRNPLANIRASAQVALGSPNQASSIERSLLTITGEVDRLDHWLRALLDVVRPLEPRLALVELNAVIEDLLSLLAERCAERRVRLERYLLPDPPAIMADEVQLQQALLGVLENALDAMPQDGTLTVRTERAEAEGRAAVRVAIRDTGEGIPTGRLKQIFEPFYSTKSKGTGLGLAITRKVVEAHEGHIEIESEPDVGTTVKITLPVGDPLQEAA